MRYVHLMLHEVMKLGSQYKSIKKAKIYAHDILPAGPVSVAQYLAGKERPRKGMDSGQEKVEFIRLGVYVEVSK